MSNPLVSVIIPVRNGERFVGQAIESVLAQTYDHREIVVVDGKSTDGSVETASSYPTVRVLQETGTGFASAWNDGLAAASGELITFLDSDDVWEPSKLERQVEVLRRRPEVDYVITRMRFLAAPGVPLPQGFKPELLESDHVANLPSALMIRRSSFDAVGPFRTDLMVANDVDWFARAKDLPLTLAVVEEVLVHKRLHDQNWSYTYADKHGQELLGLLRQSIARQRSSKSTT
jgi:glycosyltransferase involved in cell wall biosynthesis